MGQHHRTGGSCECERTAVAARGGEEGGRGGGGQGGSNLDTLSTRRDTGHRTGAIGRCVPREWLTAATQANNELLRATHLQEPSGVAGSVRTQRKDGDTPFEGFNKLGV